MSQYGASNVTDIEEYRFLKHLGAGAFASVKKAIHKPTGKRLAVKIYEKFKLMQSSRKKSVIREIASLKKLKHSCLLQIYDCIESPKQLFLIMEYVEGHSL